MLWGGSDRAVALLRLAFGDIGFRAMRFRVTKGPIAENQSTDDCLDWHQLGAGGRGGQSYCLQTPTKHLEASCYFYEIMRIRFCNPASLPVSRARSASQPLQGRFDARPSPSRQPVICRFFLIAYHLLRNADESPFLPLFRRRDRVCAFRFCRQCFRARFADRSVGGCQCVSVGAQGCCSG